MTTRIQGFTNTLADLTVPRVGRPISLALKTPGGVNARNLESQTIVPGDTSKKTTTTDNAGTYVISGDYPGDLTPTGCTLLLTEDGKTYELGGFAYSASPIDVYTLYPSPAVSGTLLMRLDLADIASAPDQGYIDIDISDTVVTPDFHSIRSNNPKRYYADINGRIAIPMYPTSLNTPNDAVYKLLWPNGTVETFVVPTTPHGWLAAWSSVTTYSKHSDTAASPSDVVTNGGLWYQCAVASSLNHAPPHADWILFPGERIVWNLQLSAGAGARIAVPANLGLSALFVALADDPVVPFVTFDDQVKAMQWRTRTHRVRKTASYAMTNDDDVVEYDGTSAAGTVTLPDVTTRDRAVIVKLVVSAAHACTVQQFTGGQAIDGATTVVLSTLYQSVRLLPNYNHTGWNVV